MADLFAQVMQFLLSALGLTAVPDMAGLGLAVALLAVAALVAVVVTTGALRTGDGSSPHPLRAIDVSTIPPQSDPSADGHPRPRAPGAVRAV